MSTALRAILIVLVVVLVGTSLFFGGMFFFGRRYAPWGGGMMGGGYGYGQGGMMGGYGYGSSGGGNYGPGMMSGYGGMMGGGMMGGYGPNSLYGVEPLTVEEAKSAVEGYLAGLKNDDLALEEIMIFDNHAYAIVIEESTKIGAFELLVDPVNQSVFPEYGPNMMWNLKYGMMSGFGGYGMMGPGMMGGTRWNSEGAAPEVSAEMPVTPDQAVQAAQDYLDLSLPGVSPTDEVTPFYGYYTIDIARDGEIVGMLSVNGYTRQVFLHTWHGDFISMSEE